MQIRPILHFYGCPGLTRSPDQEKLFFPEVSWIKMEKFYFQIENKMLKGFHASLWSFNLGLTLMKIIEKAIEVFDALRSIWDGLTLKTFIGFNEKQMLSSWPLRYSKFSSVSRKEY